MRVSTIVKATLAVFASALALSGCIIDDKPFDPTLDPPPLDDTGMELTDPQLCQRYCNAVQTNCTGENQVYRTQNDCQRICERLPRGQESDGSASVNTVLCRLRYAEAAVSEKALNCPAAGPAGSDRCGGNCEAYCWLRSQVCAGIAGQNVELERCRAQCPVLNDDASYRPDPAMTGDSLSCRMNHLVNASEGPLEAQAHCWHTSIVPEVERANRSPCSDPADTPGDCAAYCDLVMAACTGDHQEYESVEQCRAVCRAFPLGAAGDLGGEVTHNTVGCRRYHSYASLNDPVIHCSHAGPMGDGHCGSRTDNNCQSYCRILKRACTERFYAEFLPGVAAPTTLPDNPETDDLGTCEQTCVAELAETGLGGAGDSRYSILTAPIVDRTDDDQGVLPSDVGDLMQCRVYHAIQALGGPSGSDPDPAACNAAFGAAPCVL